MCNLLHDQGFYLFTEVYLHGFLYFCCLETGSPKETQADFKLKNPPASASSTAITDVYHHTWTSFIITKVVKIILCSLRNNYCSLWGEAIGSICKAECCFYVYVNTDPLIPLLMKGKFYLCHAPLASLT